MSRPKRGTPSPDAAIRSRDSGIGETERRAGLAQPIMDRDREFDGNVQFPAEFADIGDADRQHRGAGQPESRAPS